MDNHLAKFEYKGMKTVGSYGLHKLGTPKVLLTDERTNRPTKGPSGPTTRPAFAKVTQVKSLFGCITIVKFVFICLLHL